MGWGREFGCKKEEVTGGSRVFTIKYITAYYADKLKEVEFGDTGWTHKGVDKRRLRFKSDGTRAETRFRLSAKRTSPFKPAGGVSSVDYWQPRCAHQR